MKTLKKSVAVFFVCVLMMSVVMAPVSAVGRENAILSVTLTDDGYGVSDDGYSKIHYSWGDIPLYIELDPNVLVDQFYFEVTDNCSGYMDANGSGYYSVWPVGGGSLVPGSYYTLDLVAFYQGVEVGSYSVVYLCTDGSF